MAKAVGVSKATVHRVWPAHGLKPHLSKTFKVSNDPQFAEKLRDVVGLYLNPPEHALVLSCDEKSQIQALDRTQKGLPIHPGRCGTMTHDYKRNGTTTLFAAMNVAEGKVIGTCLPQASSPGVDQVPEADRRGNAARAGPALDRGQLRHAQAPQGESVAEAASAVPRAFHSHQQFVAEPGGTLVPRDHRQAHPSRHVPECAATDRGHSGIHSDTTINTPRPFVWTAKADDILAKVARARAALDKIPSV